MDMISLGWSEWINNQKMFWKVVNVAVEDDVPADAEFDAVVKELCDQITSEEFDNDIDPYEPAFDTNEEIWR